MNKELREYIRARRSEIQKHRYIKSKFMKYEYDGVGTKRNQSYTDTRRPSDRIRNRNPNTEPNHGTKSEYTNYGCRCDECRKANAKKQREWKERKRNSIVNRLPQSTQ